MGSMRSTCIEGGEVLLVRLWGVGVCRSCLLVLWLPVHILLCVSLSFSLLIIVCVHVSFIPVFPVSTSPSLYHYSCSTNRLIAPCTSVKFVVLNATMN